MSDELILKNYYNTIFNSKEYTKKITLEKLIEDTKKQVKSNKIKRTIFYIILIMAIISFIRNIPTIFYLGEYFIEGDFISLIILITSIIPIFFCFILIILFSILGKKANRKYKEMSIRLKEYQDSYDKVAFTFTELYKNAEKPNIPEQKLESSIIRELIAVFESKRADTFKEALIIYEQDCQHRELVRQQNALIATASSAQQEAKAAKKAALQAKADAEYARREANYHYWKDQ